MASGADKKAGANAVQALSPFRYTVELGQLVRGQVFDLQGLRNDPLLVDMGYVVPVNRGTELRECGECGATFIDDGALERHGRHFHDHWCDCGWVPAADSFDKDRDMAQHIKDCPVWVSDRARAHQIRLDQIAASKKATALASAS